MDIRNVKVRFENVNGITAKQVANCPWHDEKTPSLVMDRLKGTFRCYGCGVEGYLVTDAPDGYQALDKRESA